MVDNAFIENVLRKVYVDVTKSVTGVSLSTEAGRVRKMHHPVSAVVMSKGVFKSRAIFIFPKDFLNEAVDFMSHGDDLDENEWHAYAKEYVNICFGRIISKINNEMGKASRFTVPVMAEGIYDKAGSLTAADDSVTVLFASTFGTVKVSIEYALLPEYASN